MQVQIVLVHIYMATTITFVIHIVMKGKSPPSIMCTTTTHDIYYELKCDNDTIIMKILNKHKCTSPNKHYLTPSRSFMSTKEGARCKDGGDSGLDQVYFPFVIFKAAASTSTLFGAPKRYKRKSSTFTSPWRPPSRL